MAGGLGRAPSLGTALGRPCHSGHRDLSLSPQEVPSALGPLRPVRGPILWEAPSHTMYSGPGADRIRASHPQRHQGPPQEDSPHPPSSRPTLRRSDPPSPQDLPQELPSRTHHAQGFEALSRPSHGHHPGPRLHLLAGRAHGRCRHWSVPRWEPWPGHGALLLPSPRTGHALGLRVPCCELGTR